MLLEHMASIHDCKELIASSEVSTDTTRTITRYGWLLVLVSHLTF